MVSTHVLDTARGLPGAGIEVRLYHLVGADGNEIANGVTDMNGRWDAGMAVELTEAFYELEFITGAYFEQLATQSFYDVITIRFRIDSPSDKYHVPLLLSPFGYSTYRGS
ncbi:MAG: hydroxyisourate hydrolase [Candidatus Eremiobacteraeota bacterium]|nr:hydroxyisourate hydrolase [Candidatus Eremiobacteraeota bacterium]